MIKILFLLTTIGNAVFEKSSAVAPDACFERFRGEDCGMPPKPVMYYYKPGSRCEIAFWRGCRPNPNMFADEYECVRTCIFVDRAGAEDYHNFNKDEDVATDAYPDGTNDTETTTFEITTLNDTNTGDTNNNTTDDTTKDGTDANVDVTTGANMETTAANAETTPAA